LFVAKFTVLIVHKNSNNAIFIALIGACSQIFTGKMKVDQWTY